MSQRRTVFFVSDGTGITAQILGHSLLTQFEGVDFNQVTLPFVDSAERAEECLARIEAESAGGNGQPIVFSTLVNQDGKDRSEEHTSELQSQFHLVCRLLLEKKKDRCDRSSADGRLASSDPAIADKRWRSVRPL